MDKMDERFEIILYAGNSQSASLMALESAREKDFNNAEEQLSIARNELHKAHQVQTNLLQAFAGGEKKEIDVLMVHAQDHLTMASILRTISEEFTNIYKELNELKER